MEIDDDNSDQLPLANAYTGNYALILECISSKSDLYVPMFTGLMIGWRYQKGIILSKGLGSTDP